MRFIRTAIAAGLLTLSVGAQAGTDGPGPQAEDARAGHVGMGAGAAAGALIGGPPGAIVGAGLGAFFGERVAEAATAEELREGLGEAHAERAELASRLAAAGVELEERDHVIAELKRRQELAEALEVEVMFGTDSSTLGDAAGQRLARLVALLRAHPGFGVRLDGHADARGAEGHNERLSAARTEAVREALLAGGVAANRIVGFHHGARDAADDPDAWALDRRVVIRIEPRRDAARIARRELAR